MHPFLRIIFLACPLGAAACLRVWGDNRTAGSPPAAAPPAAAAVLSPELQAVYDRSCKNCHAVPASGAPQAGGAPAGGPRPAPGAGHLVEHTLFGPKNRPPPRAPLDCHY